MLILSLLVFPAGGKLFQHVVIINLLIFQEQHGSNINAEIDLNLSSSILKFTDTRIILGGNFQQLIFDTAGDVQGFDKFGNGLLIDNGVGAG